MGTARQPHAEDTAECERFLRDSGMYALFDREAQEARIGAALSDAGYCLTHVERVPTHRLVIVKGSRSRFEEPRPMPRIRRALLKGFRAEGFQVRLDMVVVRAAGRGVLVSVGILEA